MGKILSERKGDRRFERLGRWATLEYTVSSRENRFAQYADNYDSDNVKLNITIFKHKDEVHPFSRFKRVMAIDLDDFSRIVMKDTTDNLWLELSPDREKVRLYREVLE
jgi:hypothetical protein